LTNHVELPRFIRSGIAASAIGHLSVLATVLILAEVHPFSSVTAEPITVDIVSPSEAPPPPKIEETPPTPKVPDSFDLSEKSATAAQPPPQAAAEPAQAAAEPAQAAASPPQPAAPPEQATAQSKQPAAPPPQPAQSQTAPSPSPSQQAMVPSPPSLPSPSAVPAVIPQEPDVSVKYHVLLGLPNDHVGGFDAPAYKTADVDDSHIAAFRRHLKTCSILPKSVAPSDAIKIMLRINMTPDGRLASEPILVEASASAKGPALMQSAIHALQACQPYAMLPADRYGEWKVLDLSFTPQDFTGGNG
jgi:outer membrane biosynthesis protein TonB